MTTTSTGMDLGGGWKERPQFFVPDMKSLLIYKVEQKTFDAGDQGVPASIDTELYPKLEGKMFVQKKNLWLQPDPRPHSHPWAFYSKVEEGGWFKERRHRFIDGKWESDVIEHNGGETYFIDRGEIHEVIEVKPGTRTTMICGEAIDNTTWGHPDWKSGEVVPSSADPDKNEYFKVFQAANIHVFGDKADLSLAREIRAKNPDIDWPAVPGISTPTSEERSVDERAALAAKFGIGSKDSGMAVGGSSKTETP